MVTLYVKLRLKYSRSGLLVNFIFLDGRVKVEMCHEFFLLICTNLKEFSFISTVCLTTKGLNDWVSFPMWIDILSIFMRFYWDAHEIFKTSSWKWELISVASSHWLQNTYINWAWLWGLSQSMIWPILIRRKSVVILDTNFCGIIASTSY